MMKNYIAISLVIMLALVFGCAPRVLEGTKLDGDKVKQMVMGETTADKVVEMFGKPNDIAKFPTGEEYYMYKYRTSQPYWWTIDKVFSQNLDVTVKDGVVQKYKFREEGQEVVTQQ